MGETSEQHARRQAAGHVLDLVIRLSEKCEALAADQRGRHLDPHAVKEAEAVLRKCSPIIDIVSMGKTAPREALLEQWREFKTKFEANDYQACNAALLHCKYNLGKIRDGG